MLSQALLDIDGSDSVSLAELKAALETGSRLATAVAARVDTTDVMTRLREYLTDNEQVHNITVHNLKIVIRHLHAALQC